MPNFSMTSSATRTESVKDGGKLAAWFGGRLDLAFGLVLVAAGWIPILLFNHWRITAPVIFLAIGWLAVVLCGRFFWNAAMLAATEGIARDSEGFELSSGRVAELEREKRALLKAIKEVDFDREMGKMSEADATDITRVYRARAIDIIKELEGEGSAELDADAPLDTVIDREVRARLALAGVMPKRKPAQAKAPVPAAEAAEAAEKVAEAAPAAEKSAEAEAPAAPAGPDQEPDQAAPDAATATDGARDAAADDTGDAASEKTPPTIERRRDA